MEGSRQSQLAGENNSDNIAFKKDNRYAMMDNRT